MALLQPLIEALRQEVMASTGKTKMGRLWVYVRDERPPAAVYLYSPDRRTSDDHCGRTKPVR